MNNDDDLNAARGCINAVLLSIPLWILVAFIIYWSLT